MNLNTKAITKDEKRKILLDFAKKTFEQENRFVSKREIRQVFHVELYNYFNNIFDLYQHLGIDVPLSFCPREYAIKKIVDFVKDKSAKGLYPTRTELEKELGIQITTYFKSIKQLYDQSGVNFDLYLTRKRKIENPYHSVDTIKGQRKSIITYIKKRNKLGYFAGVREIQHKLKLKFYKYFESPQEAYRVAGIDYQRICPTVLGKTKEILFTKIVLHLLVELGYKIKRVSIFDIKNSNRGADITMVNKKGETMLVELKAYHKRSWITTREIEQLNRYMNRNNVPLGMFITTANMVNHKPTNIEIINGKMLIDLLRKNQLSNFIETIKWIQEKKVNNIERKATHERKRKEIIDYVVSCRKKPSQSQIEKRLHLSLKTYFESPPYSTLMYEIKNLSNDNGLLCTDLQ